jgi:hypothetical protein
MLAISKPNVRLLIIGKKVGVQLFDRENEIKLIKYLLKNAQDRIGSDDLINLYTSPVVSSTRPMN